MTTYLILVKHSVPDIRADVPANAWPLSQEGHARAQHLAEQLESFGAQVVLSSEEPKAKETAQIVASHLGLPMEVVPDLHEHDRSNVPYLAHDAFQASIRTFFQQPDQLVFGRETADQAHARFYRAVHSILNEHRDQTVIVVTHGTVISLFVSRLTGTSELELWNTLGLPSFVAIDLRSSTLIVRSNIV